jgi:hypothetical protein
VYEASTGQPLSLWLLFQLMKQWTDKEELQIGGKFQAMACIETPTISLVRSGNTQFPTWLIEGDGRELEKVSLRSSRVSPRKSDDPLFRLPFYKGQDYQMGPLWRGWRSKCRAVPKILVSSFAIKGRRIACFPCANVAFVAIPQVCWAWTSHT